MFSANNQFEQMLIVVEGARLLWEKRVKGERPSPLQVHSTEEAPGPPAESEYLQRKSTWVVRVDIIEKQQSMQSLVVK